MGDDPVSAARMPERAVVLVVASAGMADVIRGGWGWGWVEGRQFLNEDKIQFAKGTVALGAKAEVQRLTPIVEMSALER